MVVVCRVSGFFSFPGFTIQFSFSPPDVIRGILELGYTFTQKIELKNQNLFSITKHPDL